ncbi:MAG: GFA family protein [Bacteroidota bacterium]
MHVGSCLCGAVKYEVRGDFQQAVYCHCNRCRKAGGSAFAANGVAAAKDFVVVQGEATLKKFSTPAGVHRFFCSNCGSPIISTRDSLPEVLRVRLGTLDTPLDKPPSAHIFVGSKAAWWEIRDQLPQHLERP